MHFPARRASGSPTAPVPRPCWHPSAPPGTPAWPWAVLGLLCLFVLFLTVTRGFGRPGDGMVQPAALVLLYSGASFLAVVSGLVFHRRWREALPFQPGRYLFPFDFVDARSRRLRILPLSGLSDVSVVHHRNIEGGYSHSVLVLNFQHGAVESFTFLARPRPR